MDFSYDLVAAKCADQMAKYQQCVLKNQGGDWPNICRPHGKALTECADQSVPHLAEIKQNCANQIFAYRNCLEAAGSEDEEVVRVRCGEKLSALWDCTEAHMSKVKKV